MADTKIDISNRALILVGGSKISSFSDTADTAVVAETFYESTVEEILGEYPFRFCSEMIQLSRLADAPEHQWTAAYQLPTPRLVVHGLFISNEQIDYEIFEDRALCDAASTDQVFCNYAYRVDETVWPPYFKKVLELRLASKFAIPLLGDLEMSDFYLKRSEAEMSRARHADARTRPPRSLPVSKFITVRGSNRR